MRLCLRMQGNRRRCKRVAGMTRKNGGQVSLCKHCTSRPGMQSMPADAEGSQAMLKMAHGCYSMP